MPACPYLKISFFARYAVKDGPAGLRSGGKRIIAGAASLGHILPVIVLAAGCTTMQPKPASQGITPAMILAAKPILGDQSLVPLPDIDVLAMNDEMHAFLDNYLDPKGTGLYKLRQLVRAIIHEDGFGLEYDTPTLTAIETFQQRRGNCLSFTNMFVAMAREVGIKARYQEVDIPPDWTFEGGTYVLNRHVNVMVNIPNVGKRIVDFNDDNFQGNYKITQISDRRALAHYYNNMGVEKLHADDNVEALRYFLKAIDHDRDFGPTWVNLGTLYRRNGHLDYAEAAYVYSLRSASGRSVAMSNLVRVYEELGDTHRAELYRKKVNAHRMRNPYYRYQLGRQAFDDANYDEAITQLKSAIRLNRNEHRFFYQLGLTYLEVGESSKARRSLNTAVELATTDAMKDHYRKKIDDLFFVPGDGRQSGGASFDNG